MKKVKNLFLIATTGAVLISCGVEKSPEEKAENVVTESAEVSSLPNVNANLSISLKETSIEKAGLTIGLPENWTVDIALAFEGAPTYFVNRNGQDVLVVETFQNESSEETLQSILDGFGSSYKIISKEDLAEKDNVKIIGVVNHNAKNKEHRQVQFRYLAKFTSGKTKYANYTPGDAGYKSAMIDTCIAIIKSIKPKK